jgi:hypothetical protein
MLLPSLLMSVLRAWARSVPSCQPSHPPRPRAVLSTHRPTDCFAIDYPERALFPTEHRRRIDFVQLRSLPLLRSSLDQSKRARVKEHRLSKNTIDLVCRLPRAQGLTRLVHPILVCALGEQRKLPSLPSSLPGRLVVGRHLQILDRV